MYPQGETPSRTQGPKTKGQRERGVGKTRRKRTSRSRRETAGEKETGPTWKKQRKKERDLVEPAERGRECCRSPEPIEGEKYWIFFIRAAIRRSQRVLVRA